MKYKFVYDGSVLSNHWINYSQYWLAGRRDNGIMIRKNIACTFVKLSYKILTQGWLRTKYTSHISPWHANLDMSIVSLGRNCIMLWRDHPREQGSWGQHVLLLLSSPGGPHGGPMNLAIWDAVYNETVDNVTASHVLRIPSITISRCFHTLCDSIDYLLIRVTMCNDT